MARRSELLRAVAWAALGLTAVLDLTASHAAAQTATPTLPAPPGSRTQIVLLGSAGGPPLRLHRAEPSTLLVVDGRLYLFDCGLGAVRQSMAAGFRPEDINTVFLTHHHPDHTLDLVGLMGNAAFTADAGPNPQKLKIYGPPGTVAFTDAAITYLGVPFGQFAAENLRPPWPPIGLFEAHDVSRDGLVYSDDKIRVFAVENSHYSQMTPAAREGRIAFSYRIETPDAAIVITGDTGPSAAVTKLAEGADVLVTEAMDMPSMEALLERIFAARPVDKRPPPAAIQTVLGHMRFEHLDLPEVGKLAADAHVRSVIVTHIGPEADAFPDKGTFAARIQQGLTIPVMQGRDLARYCIAPKGAGGAAVAECEKASERP
jgi:ribonuclease BN (tRNA processing enzyme)